MAWRSPSFTTVAVLSLAAGIGAATAVFGAVDAVLLRRLAVTAPDQLVDVVGHAAAARKDIKALPASTYEDLVRAVDFADLIAFRSVPEVDLASADVPTQVVAAELVSSNYFSVLGSRALAGRLPAHGDIGPWVVLSENLWRTRFGSDREMPGRTITVNGTTLTIAGVVRDFRGLVVDRPKDLFVPLAAATNVEARRPPNDPVRVVARLRPAYDARVAAERLSGLFTRLLPASQNWGPVTVVLNPAMRGISDVRSQAAEPLLLLLGG